jgi:hypothetical protein
MANRAKSFAHHAEARPPPASEAWPAAGEGVFTQTVTLYGIFRGEYFIIFALSSTLILKRLR